MKINKIAGIDEQYFNEGIDKNRELVKGLAKELNDHLAAATPATPFTERQIREIGEMADNISRKAEQWWGFQKQLDVLRGSI